MGAGKPGARSPHRTHRPVPVTPYPAAQPPHVGARHRVLMLLENNAYPEDVRVLSEARTLVEAGHEVSVLAPRGPGQRAREVLDGVLVRRYRLPSSAGGALGFLGEYLIAHAQLFPRALLGLARGATVVHLHNPPDTLFPVALAARALRRAAVFDHHDLAPELYLEKFGRSRLVGLLRLAQRASFRSASHVLVTNESQRQAALSAGVRPDKLSVVRNGPRSAMIEQYRHARGGALRDPRLVFVGELGSQDGVAALPGLLQAVRARPESPAATLVVVGDGSLRADLGRELAERGLTDSVTMTGRVGHQDVPRLIAEADICIDVAPCSELNHRSTMIKIGEYLAAGRPVVAYDLLETRRTAGDAAVYAACGDQRRFVQVIAELAQDPQRRDRLARSGRARAPELAWERSEASLLDAYARLGRLFAAAAGS